MVHFVIRISSIFFLIVLISYSLSFSFVYSDTDANFPTEKQLVLNSYYHHDLINRIDVNSKCTRILTGSYDKTAKLWDIDLKVGKTTKPKLLQIYRPPININGHIGKIYAVALDPKNQYVAISGYTPSSKKNKWSLYIFDLYSAEIKFTIDDNPHRIMHLDFSNDGKYLVATMKSGIDIVGGMRVWEREKWNNPLFSDTAGYGHSYGAVFDNNNNIYTVSYPPKNQTKPSGYIRKYELVDKKYRITSKTEINSINNPYGIAIHPKDNILAISALDTPNIKLYNLDNNNITEKTIINTEGISASDGVGKISWSFDGNKLFAGGSYNKDKNYYIRSWDVKDNYKTYKDVETTKNFVSQIKPCENGLGVASRAPSFGIIDNEVNKLSWQTNYKNTKHLSSIEASKDGSVIKLGNSNDNIYFDINTLRLRKNYKKQNSFFHKTKITGLPITGWKETQGKAMRPVNPKFDGNQISEFLKDKKNKDELIHRASDDEEWVSLAINTDTTKFILSSEWRIRLYNTNEYNKPIWRIKAPGNVIATHITKDDKKLIASFTDGTIRWYDIENKKELFSLYFDRNNFSFIIWTSEGYYQAGTNGDDLIGWVFNKGHSSSANYYPAYLFQNQYSLRKNLAKRILDTLDVKGVIKSFKNPTNKKEETSPPPPKIRLLSNDRHNINFNPTFDNKNRMVRLPFKVDLNLGTIGKLDIEAWVNGLFITRITDSSNGTQEEFAGAFELELPLQDSEIVLVAKLKELNKNQIIEDEISVKYKFTGQEKVLDPPLLLALIVAGSNYEDKNQLQFIEKDKNDFNKALKEQINNGTYHKDSKIITIPNSKTSTTKDAVETELIKLKYSIEKSGIHNTLSFFFYAGHGLNKSNGDFNLKLNSSELISEDEIKKLFFEIPGKKAIFLDACYSGELNYSNFLNELSNNRKHSVISFSSSTNDETSGECKNHDNGCFTQAILEAIENGYADTFDPINITTTDELRRYIVNRVPDLQKGQNAIVSPLDINAHQFIMAKHPAPVPD